MYTVIGNPMTRAIRVVWCLEELGVDYDIIPAAPRSDEMKQYNPSGKAPALKVGDDIIIDSVAICQFLADRHGGLTFPAGSVERAKMDSFIHFAADEVDQACWVWAKHDRFYPEDFRAEKAKNACAYEFKKAMKHLENRLGGNQFVMGDTFTIPDILLGQCATWASGMCGFELPSGKVGAYFDRVQARPALARARAAAKASVSAL